MSRARTTLSGAALALAGLAGCLHEPRIILTTRLPVEAPAGQNEDLLYAMCTDMGPANAHPDDALKVTFYKPGGRTAVEQTIRCDEVRKKFKPKNEK